MSALVRLYAVVLAFFLSLGQGGVAHAAARQVEFSTPSNFPRAQSLLREANQQIAATRANSGDSFDATVAMAEVTFGKKTMMLVRTEHPLMCGSSGCDVAVYLKNLTGWKPVYSVVTHTIGFDVDHVVNGMPVLVTNLTDMTDGLDWFWDGKTWQPQGELPAAN